MYITSRLTYTLLYFYALLTLSTEFKCIVEERSVKNVAH